MQIPRTLSERRPETSQVDDDLGLTVDDQRVPTGRRDQVETVVDKRLYFGLNSTGLRWKRSNEYANFQRRKLFNLFLTTEFNHSLL